MKRNLLLICLFLSSVFSVKAQFVGTPYPFLTQNRPVLDHVGVTPSFAFSTRKLREDYAGYALRIRRSSDNAQADVAFDDNNVVSNTSIVTLTDPGTSGLSIGSTITLSDFRGGVGATFYVSIWYDQGTKGYNAIQSTTTIQPILSIGSAGSNNQYASILFSGLTNPQSVIVNQPMEVLLGNVTAGKGLRGTLGLIAKTTSNSNQNSFGYSVGQVRWSVHMNWSDGNCYVDLGDASDINRSFVNGSRLNLYKQYLFIRANATKTMRVSASSQANNVPQNLNAGLSGGSFGIGHSVASGSTIGFSGNIPEFILYPEPLTLAQYSNLENNQITFWGAN
jgi:hypothetical protein